MQKRVSVFFARFGLVSLVVIGGFFYAQGVGAQAQRPDLRITKATFDGLNLHVEYVNATGVGYPRVRYEVGFRWHDASGSAVGTRHWLNVPEVERGGVSILDNKYRIDLTYQGRDGRNYNRTLSDFLYQRPDRAEELRVMVDDGNRVSETDESNNIARLRIPLPDLQITGAKFLAPNRLELSYRNANPSPIPLPFRIGFTWAEESGAHLTFTRFMNVLEPEHGTTKTEVLSRTDVSYINAQGRQVGDRLDWYLEKRPANATRLKIMIDEAGTIPEITEHNNLVSVRPDLPDLQIGTVTFDPEGFSLTFQNGGGADAIAPSIWFHFADARGAQLGSLAWFDAPTLAVGSTATLRCRDITLVVLRGPIPCSDFLAERPDGATHLKVLLDGPARLGEYNENNNSATVALPPLPEEPEEEPIPEPPPPPKFPDLTITKETLDGAALRYLYHNNGEGAAEPAVSLWYEWVDAQGKRIGDLYWINVGGMTGGSKREGNQLMDISTLEGEQGKIKLGDLVYYPPPGAYHLKLTIDGPNAHAESNEQNNSVLLPVLRTDFTITDAEFRNGFPWYKYHNRGNLGSPAGKTISFWFEWVDARGARLGDLHWLDVDPPLILSSRAASLARSTAFDSTTTVFSAKGPAKLAAFLNSAPDGATHLKITIDGPNAYAEQNEANNVVQLAVQPRVPPDFSITGLSFSPDVLALQVSNKGGSYTGPLSVWFHFSNIDGIKQGPLFWADLSLSPNKLGWFFSTDFGGKFTSEDGQYSLAEFLGKTPPDATSIKILADGPNRIVESNEQNNTSSLALSVAGRRPDLTLIDAIFKDGELAFTYRNAGNLPIRYTTLWLYFADSAGTQIGTRYWVEMAPLSAESGRKFSSKDVVVKSDSGTRPLKEVLQKWPAAATHLKILADGPNQYLESDEKNNEALLDRAQLPPPKPPDQKLPDLALTGGSRSGGVLKVTIVNGTSDTLRLPFLQFKWLDAQGTALKTSPVSYWQHETIAPGKTGDFTLEYEKWREDGVVYFLKHPPSGAVALLATIDPENKLKESNEDNNAFRIALGQPDLAYGTPVVRSGALIIPVINHGAAASVATDIWLQWYGGGKWLPSAGAVDVPAVASGATVEISVLLDRSFGADGQILINPPPTAERLRLFLDGSRKVDELDEQNNTVMLPRAVFSEAQPVAPELKLTLTVEKMNSAQAAASSSATAGFLLALAALLTGGLMIHAQSGAPKGARGALRVFPLLFASPSSSYMRLNGCGPEGCAGNHFERHKTLKRLTRLSLLASVLTGAAKIGLAFAIASVAGPISPLHAEALEARVGEDLRATLTAKNTGAARAEEITLTLPCPDGAVWKESRMNGRGVSKSADSGLSAPDLEKGAAHTLEITCAVKESALAKPTLRFSGVARAKGATNPFISNTVEVKVAPKPEPEKPPEPKGQPDLAVIGVGLLAEDAVSGDNLPFTATFTAIVENKGASRAPAATARLRIDVGADGTYDITVPGTVPPPEDGTEIAAGGRANAQWAVKWRAPLGSYAFDICVDTDNAIAESNEGNNCAKDNFELKVGQEPIFEEG